MRVANSKEKRKKYGYTFEFIDDCGMSCIFGLYRGCGLISGACFNILKWVGNIKFEDEWPKGNYSQEMSGLVSGVLMAKSGCPYTTPAIHAILRIAAPIAW